MDNNICKQLRAEHHTEWTENDTTSLPATFGWSAAG
jgi:hypothetical protein